jgi:hypothetical protein
VGEGQTICDAGSIVCLGAAFMMTSSCGRRDSAEFGRGSLIACRRERKSCVLKSSRKFKMLETSSGEEIGSPRHVRGLAVTL